MTITEPSIALIGLYILTHKKSCYQLMSLLIKQKGIVIELDELGKFIH